MCLRAALRDAAEAVFLHGSTPWEVDEAMEQFGFARGPFEAEDATGLDIALAWRAAEGGAQVLPILPRMLELGKLGRKTGAGWYRYPGGGGKVDDPIVADLALEEAHFHGLTRVDYSASEIRERLLVALIHAAADLMARGVPAPEIDRASRACLGFPGEKVGLMTYAAGLRRAHLHQMVARVRQEGVVQLRGAPDLVEIWWPSA